ncbi:MAG TPA: tyrosine-protein phosphatase, partial [Gaiellaceae bacterium]|nr:tyrosine-protein phosphatase [Gaiellaceae bacterium]
EWDEIAEELETANATPDDVAATRDAYLIFLEHFRANVAAAFAAVADAPDGAVVIHCVGGKDRTGLLCAFLLQLAGVPDDEIADDYALSEERLLPRHQGWLDAAETHEERERLRRIAQCPADAMRGVLRELERRYGGVAGYLRAAGVGEDQLERAGSRLR